MSKKRRFNEKQWAAIAILAQPKRGGLTYEQVAEKVGIARSTLQEWRKDDDFNEEIKRQVLRNAIDDLPNIYAAVPGHIIDEGNAAMFRTFVQSLGMLTEKVEMESKGGNGAVNIDEIKARIAQMKREGSEAE